ARLRSRRLIEGLRRPVCESPIAIERENRYDEADVSAEPASARQGPWVPGAHEDQGRAQRVETPAGQGAQTADRVRLSRGIARRERLTGSGDFQSLFQRGKRVDRSSLIVLWAEAPARRVGFAVSRQVGGAVKRNRVRRRLREAYRAARDAA